MTHSLHIDSLANKEEQYKTLIPQLVALTDNETDPMANTANIIAAVHHTFSYLWTGVYWVQQSQLVLGAFQGPIACTRIGYGKGVCGHAWQQGRTIIVPDVEAFAGHIACSSLSRSEIVVPIFDGQQIIGVLDVDSAMLNTFDETDGAYLEKICVLISKINIKK